MQTIEATACTMRQPERPKGSTLRPALIGASCLLAAGLAFAGPAQAAKKLLASPTTTQPKIDVKPQVPLDKGTLTKVSLTTLQVTRDKGEFEKWEKAITIDTPRKFWFQWKTGKQAYEAATWQVGEEGSQAVLASGAVAGGPFQALTPYGLTIDLKPLLPAKPDAQPKTYWVRVVPQQGGQALGASTAAKITYSKPGPAPQFDFDYDLFAQNLVLQLDGKTMGYEYAIYHDGVLMKAGANGFAVQGSKPMTPDTRISIGSTSKTVTAVAVMRALEMLKGKGVTLDSTIAQYLPSTWEIGAHVNDITLKDLLRHTSGLTQGVDEYGQLKALIAAGASAGDWQNRAQQKYCNCNFTLLRIILPYMVHGREAMEANLVDQVLVSKRTSDLYVEFVQKQVLAKVGLGNVWINPRGSEAMRYYNFDNPSQVFTGYSDDTARAGVGAGFWFMSAKEYGKFISGLKAGKIIPASAVQTMTSNILGMWRGTSRSGTTFNHNGAFTYDDPGAGMRGAWMLFPDGTVAVIYYNSANWKTQDGAVVRGANGKPVEEMAAPQTIITNAYNAAFDMKQVQY
jgi:hypothetical protein